MTFSFLLPVQKVVKHFLKVHIMIWKTSTVNSNRNMLNIWRIKPAIKIWVVCMTKNPVSKYGIQRSKFNLYFKWNNFHLTENIHQVKQTVSARWIVPFQTIAQLYVIFFLSCSWDLGQLGVGSLLAGISKCSLLGLLLHHCYWDLSILIHTEPYSIIINTLVKAIPDSVIFNYY